MITTKGHNILTRVRDLIDPNANQWDEELLNQTFWQVDVQRILAIPLPNFGVQDFVVWNLTKTGSFFVYSAYHLEWDSQYGSKLAYNRASGPFNSHPMWEGIWKLKVQSKMKIFLWRVMQDIVPCRAVLENRHIKVSAQCPICERGAEDIKHMLFLCPRAKLIWKQLGLEQAISYAFHLDRAGQAVLELLLSKDYHITPVRRIPLN